MCTSCLNYYFLYTNRPIKKLSQIRVIQKLVNIHRFLPFKISKGNKAQIKPKFNKLKFIRQNIL